MTYSSNAQLGSRVGFKPTGRFSGAKALANFVTPACPEARAYLPRPVDAGSWFATEYTRCMLRDAWLEDGSTLEASQVGIASGVIDHFILQDQELMIRHYHKVLNEYVQR